jgi:phospholipid-binding lipoprotein MlaA
MGFVISRPLIFFYLSGLAIFFFFGCAHKTGHDKPDSFDSKTVSSGSQIQAAAPSAKDSPDLEKEDDVFDEFEEEFQSKSIQIADPLAPFNKAMFYFNDKFYFWFLKPIIRGYAAIFPEFARTGVRNFFRNIFTPIRFTNSLLQGKSIAAGNELTSFFVNSTVGILGFGAPAQSKHKIALSDEDLGQTFGAYGIGNGFYIVWPILGPSSLRDTVGFVGDGFLNPISYVDPTEAAITISFYDRVNETSFRIGEYESIKEAAIDPYVAIRNGYVQFRNAKIAE